ncbi:MAG: hypothetical protein HDS03_01095 [Bacteroides sp.]|nr:hypothetical protein [Bacteroides sp.]
MRRSQLSAGGGEPCDYGRFTPSGAVKLIGRAIEGMLPLVANPRIIEDSTSSAGSRIYVCQIRFRNIKLNIRLNEKSQPAAADCDS